LSDSLSELSGSGERRGDPITRVDPRRGRPRIVQTYEHKFHIANMINPTKSKYMHAWIALEEVVGVGDCLVLPPASA
jgi:hypothetical protein